MLRRSLPLLLLLTVLLGLYLAPQLPPIRSWLLEQVEGVVRQAGYELSYRRSAGNLWRGLALEQARVSGAGLELEAERLRVGYFLPGLLNGQLPLSIRAQGVRGQVTMSALRLPEADEGARPGGIRPLLREIDVREVSLELTDVPYTLPDTEIVRLQARSTPQGVTLETTLRTAEGEAQLRGVLQLEPFSFDGEVLRADATVARHWWDGIEAGEVSGPLRVSDGQVRADARVTGGAVRFLNERVTEIAGEVTYRHPDIETGLRGRLLGGDVAVTGGVAIADARWFAEAEGEVALAETSLWLARLASPELRSFPASGRAELQLRGSGWTAADLSGALRSPETSPGTLLGYPLEDLRAAFSVSAGAGAAPAVRSEVTAGWAGGELSASLEPEAEGFALDLRGAGLALVPASRSELAFEGRSGPGGLHGDGELRLAGSLLGQDLEALADLMVDADGYQTFLSGTALGGTLEGAAVLQGGQLSGQINASELSVPGLAAPIGLSLQAAGPIGDLPLTLSLPEGTVAELADAGLRASVPLAGSLRATLAGARLQTIEGQLGALSLSGDLELASGTGELAYALEPVILSAPVAADLSLEAGRLTLTDEGLSGAATLRSSALERSGLGLPPLSAELDYQWLEEPGDGLSVSLRDEGLGLAAHYREGELALELAETPLTLAGQRLSVTGAASLEPQRWLETLQAQLQAQSEDLQLVVEGPATGLELALTSERFAAELTGELALDTQVLRLSGEAAGYALAAEGSLREMLSLRLGSGEEVMTLSLREMLSAPDLRAAGSLRLEPLAALLGLSAQGSARGDLQWQAGGFTGALELDGQVVGQAVQLTATGQGNSLVLTGTADAYGLPLTVSGPLLPETNLSAESEWGALTFSGSGGQLSGGGTLPTLEWAGFRVAAQPWELSGALDSGLRLTLPESGTQLRAERGASGWAVAGTLAQSAQRGDVRLDLGADFRWSPELPDGALDGNLTLSGPEAAASLPLTGDLQGLELSGELSAALLSELAGLPLELAGTLELSAALEPRAPWAYRASGSWRSADETLELSVEGTPSTLSAQLSGAGLELSYQNGSASVAASAFALGPWLARPALTGLASGRLEYSPQNGGSEWRGDLQLGDVGLAAPEGDSSALSADLTLSGQGEALLAQALVDRAGLTLRATGPLLPRLELQVSGGYRDLLSLDGTLRGPLGNPALRAQLESGALELPGLGFALSPQSFELSGDLATGLRLQGASGDLVVSADALAGTLELPFQLEQATHTLGLALSGSPQAPELSGELRGPYLSGPLELVASESGRPGEPRLQAELRLEPQPWLPAGLEADAAQLRLSAQADLRWRAELSAAGRAQGQALALELAGEGQALRYAAAGTLSVQGQALPLQLAGEDGAAQLSATLTTFDLGALELPTDLAGAASGEVRFDTGASPALTFEVEAAGEVASQRFDLELLRSAAQGPTLRGEVAGTAVALTQQAAQSYALELARPEDLELSALLDLADGLSLRGTGHYRQQALELRAQYRASAQAGDWRVGLGEASWQGELTGSLEAGRLSSQLELPENGPSPAAGEAEVALGWQQGQVELQALEAQSRLGGEALTLRLSGPAWPAPSLRGELSTAAYGVFDLEFAEDGAGYALRAHQPSLNLTADLSRSFGLGRVDVVAEAARLPLASGLELEGALGWQAEAGFSGELALALRAGELAASATAIGQAQLELAAALAYRGEPLASLDGRLAAQPLAADALTGNVALSTEFGALWPAYPGEPLALGGALELAGSLFQPRLEGPLSLQGALEADGSLAFATNRGSLELRGSGLELAATVTPEGWRLSGTSDGLDLSRLLPHLPAASLQADFAGEQAWGEAPRLSARELALASAAGSLRGELTYEGDWRGRLRGEVDLSGLELGAALSGKVQGHLSLLPGAAGGAPELSGLLEAEDLGLATDAARLGGSLILSGPLPAPNLSLRLSGSGSASGQLFATLEPATSQLAITSTLAVAGLSSDLNLALERDTLRASGSLRWQDWVLAVSDASSRERVVLEGRERLAGWQLAVLPAAAQFELSGELSSVADVLSGALELQASWQAQAVVTGAVRDLRVGTVALGDLNLESQVGAPEHLRLWGEALAADIDLSAGPSWRLERLALPLSEGWLLQAEGTGDLARAELAASLGGTLLGEPLLLPLALDYRDATLRLQGNSALLGGALALDASASQAGGWQGTLALQDATLSGAELALSGTLTGPLSAPAFNGELALEHANLQSSGRVEASPDGVSLEQVLHSPLLRRDLSLAGRLWPAPELRLSDSAGETLSLRQQEGGAQLSGSVLLEPGPLDLYLEGGSGGLELKLSLPEQPGLALQGQLPAEQLASPASLLDGNLVLYGSDRTSGTLRLSLADPVSLSLEALAWQSPAGRLELNGTLSGQNGGQGALEGHWQGANGEAPSLPWLGALEAFELHLALQPDAVTLAAEGDGSLLAGRYDRQGGTGELSASLEVDGSRAEGSLSFEPAAGLQGELSFSDFPLLRDERGEVSRLSATLVVTPEAALGQADLTLSGGRLNASGRLGLGLLPGFLAPRGETGGTLNLATHRFDPLQLPWLSGRLPYLAAPLDADVTLSGSELRGRLQSSELSVGDTTLPLEARISGRLQTPRLEGSLGDTAFEVSLGKASLSGLVRFQSFPLEKLVEARLGPTGVSSALTGALRFEVPRGPGDLYLRFASEAFRLERSGVVTEGDLSFEIADGGLVIQNAAFEGRGSWRASGEASPERLDLRLEAQEADFDPLLGLVPQLAAFDVGAFGSLQLVTSGSLSEPIVRASSPALDLRVGGTGYALEDASFTLQNQQFVTSAQLEATAPLSGTLSLSGGGIMALFPERRFDLTLQFSGDTALPVFGEVQGVSGQVTVAPSQPWQLESSGLLGTPFQLAGSLAPLDLRLQGERLALRAPRYFLADSATDVDLRFYADGEYYLTGTTFVHEASLRLEASEGADRARQARGEAESEAGASPARRRNPVLSRIHFQTLRLQAPQQVTFQENFGSAELAADLTLSGTAQEPQLSGEARSLRGLVRFAGRDFSLEQAVASFEPSRGIYPTLAVTASTSFEKARIEQDYVQIQRNAPGGLEIVEPPGSSFGVFLDISGELRQATGSARGFEIDLSNRLSSNAQILEPGSAAPRALSEPELLSLLTLGRLELSPELVSQGGLATSLAQGAVDTAVDYFVLSELQSALGEALGLDLLEIRTTTLGTLLTGDGDDSFGVSLRIGAYLSDEVFASYRIGSLGLDENVTLSNEFNVRYDLYPLEVNLAGRLDFLDDPSLTPTPQIDINIGYAASPLIRVQAGVSLSNQTQGVNFGVSFRW